MPKLKPYKGDDADDEGGTDSDEEFFPTEEAAKRLKAATIIESLDEEEFGELLAEIGDLNEYEPGPLLRVVLMKKEEFHD